MIDRIEYVCGDTYLRLEHSIFPNELAIGIRCLQVYKGVLGERLRASTGQRIEKWSQRAG